jgi:hypothetical protein
MSMCRTPLLTLAIVAAMNSPAVWPATRSLPTPPNFGTYSVLEIGAAKAPKLNSKQTAWMHLIHADPAYRKIWSELRWTLVAVNEQRTPVIVFDVVPGKDSLTANWFPIIGEVCNVAFDPTEGDVATLPHFDVPCKPSEQPPVRGQKALLGWQP